MCEILRKWLVNRLGVILDFNPVNFGKNIQDGRMIAYLLLSYGIITNEQVRIIIPTDNPIICRENLRNIQKWLQRFDFTDDSLFEDIANGNGVAAIKFLHQLYLAFENTKTHLISQKVPNEYTISKTRFTVTKVNENVNLEEKSCNPLAKPLLKKQCDLVSWYRTKYEEIEKNLAEIRKNYVEQIEERQPNFNKKNITKKNIQLSSEQNKDYKEFCKLKETFDNECHEIKNYTYDELLDLMQRAKLCEQSPAEAKNEANKIIERLKMKFRQNDLARDFRSKTELLIQHELWHNLIDKEEEEFDKLIAKKALKQSKYEKQMVTKCLEIRNQTNILTANKQHVDNLIKQKREEEFNKIFDDYEEIDEEYIKNYKFEKERMIELHQRLYRKKLCARAKENYNFCKEIVNAFIDIAILNSHYTKQYQQEVPKFVRRNWATLFIMNKPLYAFLENVENIINQTPGLVDNVTFSEYTRQDALNKNNVEEYLNYLGQWELSSLFDEDFMPETDSTNGMLVIGNIVHRLLMEKYPKPSNAIPPKLPPFKFKVCAIGINDYKLMPVLEELLKEKNILLFEVQNVINYCLRIFRNNMIGIEDIEAHFQDETFFIINPETFPAPIPKIKIRKDDSTVEISSEFKTKEISTAIPVKSIVKKTSTKSIKSKQSKEVKETVEVEFSEKQCQTPKNLSAEVVKESLSREAQLGKYAYESLTLGKPLTDYTIVHMIIAYLKTLDKYKGWVLLNYPTTLKQANILESTVTCQNTGIKIELTNSDESIDVQSNYVSCFSESNLTPFDPDKHKRQSKLIKCPNIYEHNDEYTSFLTAFITAKNDEQKNPCDAFDDVTPVEKFYTDQGLCYILYYNVFDFSTIKQLAKLIIGDYTIPVKTSEELFGRIYDELKEKYDSGQKCTKLPTIKKPEFNVCDACDEEMENVDEISRTYEILPGDLEWKYVDVKVCSAILYGLGTIWNNMENIYLDDLEELLFIKRVHRGTIVPYISYVRDHMKKFVSHPDNKQDLVQNFQMMYNSIEDDIRNDEDVRSELHCRVEELRDKLWSICDERMKEAEDERQRIIKENWIADQLTFLTNLFLSLFEIEMSRCCDTLQVIQDYYLSMLGIPLNPDDRIEKPKVEKLNTIEKSKLTQPDKTTQQIFIPNFPKDYNNFGRTFNDIIAEILIEKDNKTIKQTPLIEFITKKLSTIKSLTSSWETKAIKILNEQKNLKKNIKSEITPEIKKSLFDEWFAAVNSEMKRIHLRLDVIKAKAINDLDEILQSAQNTFYNIYNQISDHYNREVSSVTTICEIFASAIENQIKIQQELSLEDDKFLVYSDKLLFPHKMPSVHSINNVRKRIPDSEFSICQLVKFYHIFKDIAPTGSIPERVITFILQDIIFLDADDGFHNDIPIMWKQIEPSKLGNVLADMFGDTEFVDWRDFIIYNMGVPFPTEKQILKTFLTYRLYDTNKSELINKTHYLDVPLWFEYKEEIDDSVVTNQSIFYSHDEFNEENSNIEDIERKVADERRLIFIKKLLFKMFETREDLVNYTSLLLAFCKDLNPIVGMAKALSLVLGSLIGWDPTDGQLEKQKDIEMATKNEKNSISDDSNCTCGNINLIDLNQPTIITKDTEENVSEDMSFNNEECPGEIGRQRIPSIALIHKYSDEELTIFKKRTYLLSFNHILSMLAVTFPWHIRNQCMSNNSLHDLLKTIFEDLRERHTNMIYAFRFLQHPIIIDMLQTYYKFQDLYPPDIIRKYLLGSK